MNNPDILWEGKPSFSRFKLHGVDYMPIYISIFGSVVLWFFFAMIIINDIFIRLPLIFQIIFVFIVTLPLFLIIRKAITIRKMILNTRFIIYIDDNQLKLSVFRHNHVKRIENLNNKYLYISRRSNDVLILENHLDLDNYKLTVFMSSLMYKPKSTLKLTAIEKNKFIKSVKPYFKHYRLTKDYFIAQVKAEL